MVRTTRRNVAGAIASTVAAVRGLRKRKSSTVMMKRRPARRTRTATKTRNTRRKKTTQVETGEYSKTQVSLGRKPRQDVRGAWKYLNQNISKMRYGFRQYASFGSLSGIMRLENVSPTQSTGTLVPPCHFYEITSCINVQSGAVLVPNIRWIPTFTSSTDTANIVWSNGDALQIENSTTDTANADSYPGGTSTLEYMSLKLLAYPPLTIPCRWQVDIIQIKDDRLIPDGASTSKFCCAAYQSYLKPFIKSSLESGSTAYNRYFKKLYSQTWIMNPKETVENVANVMKEVQIFFRLNRKMNYAWNEDDLMNMHTVETQRNLSGSIKMQVLPKQRIFISIRAQAANATAWSQSTMPSYDIALTMQHSQLAA